MGNVYRYYMDPKWDDIVWRVTNGSRMEARFRGQYQTTAWIQSACNEFEDFVKDEIHQTPADELPDWVWN